MNELGQIHLNEVVPGFGLGEFGKMEQELDFPAIEALLKLFVAVTKDRTGGILAHDF